MNKVFMIAIAGTVCLVLQGCSPGLAGLAAERITTWTLNSSSRASQNENVAAYEEFRKKQKSQKKTLIIPDDPAGETPELQSEQEEVTNDQPQHQKP